MCNGGAKRGRAAREGGRGREDDSFADQLVPGACNGERGRRVLLPSSKFNQNGRESIPTHIFHLYPVTIQRSRSFCLVIVLRNGEKRVEQKELENF